MPGTEYVIKYIGDLSDALSSTKELERVNADMAKTITTDFQQATRIVGRSIDKITEIPISLKGGKKAIETVAQLGTVIQTSDGSYKEFIKTQTFINGILLKSSGSLKDVTNQFSRTNLEIEKGKKSFLTLGENVQRLAQRAILTIPLWIALRSAITGIFATFRDGFKAIEEEDRAFQKLKRTLQGSVAEINRNFGRLREEINKLSLESGISEEKIAEAFYRFTKAGFDFETSLQATTYALKTAIVTFSDVDEVANAFSRSMEILVDRSEDAKPAGEQIADAMALTAELWKTNNFDLNIFTQSLERFATTAKATNLSTRQTIVLLSALNSAGIRGSRAGTTLRTSIVKLLQNLDKLGGTLGIKVNPSLDSTFSILIKVLDAVQGLDAGSQTAQKSIEILGKVFGGIRGTEAILALKTLREELLKNINITGGIEKLNQAYEDTNKIVSRQLDIFHNLNKEIGEAFVSAVIGGENFAKTMQMINNNILPYIKIGLEEIGNIINQLAKYNLASPFGGVVDEITKIRKEQAKLFEDITMGLKGGLGREQLIEVLARIRIMTEDRLIEISPRTISALEQKLKEATEKLTVKPEITVQQTVKQRVLTQVEQQDIAKAVLGVELDRLRALGATNSQLLKAEELYSRQLGIEEQTIDKVKRKLEIEKAINEEKRLQNDLGSTSVKLFEIAQTEGTEVARKIGDVLAGQTDFTNFVKIGGKELEVFKKEFGDIYKQQQATAFFRGEQVSGMPELQGGFGIPIEEEFLRKTIPTFTPGLELQKEKAVSEFQRIEGLNVTVEAPIQINANIDASQLDEVQEAFVNKIAEQLPQAGSTINKALAQALGNKQNQVI